MNAGLRSCKFGRCEAGAKRCHILRHGNNHPKQLAGKMPLSLCHLEAMTYHKKHTTAGATTQSGLPTSIKYEHVLFARTLIETGGSFLDFGRWAQTARLSGAALPPGMDSQRISKQLVQVMGAEETHVTAKLMASSCMNAIADDAREELLAVLLRGVLWSWPRGLQRGAKLPTGVVSLNNGKAPWIITRVLGVSDLGPDHSAESKATAREAAVRKNCPTPTDFKHAQDVTRVFCGDTAFDQTSSAKFSQVAFNKMRIHIGDSLHIAMLCLKHALKADDEVKIVMQLFVDGGAGSEMPGLAKFLTTSKRFREEFKQEEVADCVQVLHHFGWAPQRCDTKKKAKGRVILRLKQSFSITAKEAEGRDPKRKAWGKELLRQLGGPNSKRILLGGMLADLAHEHSKWARSSDTNDPDPTQAEEHSQQFLRRLKKLFTEGLILSDLGKDTFTGQALAFLKASPIIYYSDEAQPFSMATQIDNEFMFEPLTRIRNVVKVLEAFMTAEMPQCAWQRRLKGFQLPSPLHEHPKFQHLTAEEKTHLKTIARTSLLTLFHHASLPAKKVYLELKQLLPAAEAHRAAGASIREAWGRASADFPEYADGREGINLLLSATISTGAVERLLRLVPWQEQKNRARMLNSTLESLILASQAPLVQDMADCKPNDLGHSSIILKGPYLPKILRRYVELYGSQKPCSQRKRRRDTGIALSPEKIKQQRLARGAPETEAEFLRKREVAIEKITAATPEETQQLLVNSLMGPPVPPEEEVVQQALQGPAYTKALQQAASIASRKHKLHHRSLGPGIPGSRQASKKTRWSHTGPGEGSIIPAGLALVLSMHEEVLYVLRRKRFTIHQGDPVTFIKACISMSARKKCGHLVVIDSHQRDFISTAAVACRIVSGFLCETSAVLKASEEGHPQGIQFQYQSMCKTRYIYVSNGVRAANPGLYALLHTSTKLPGSTLCLVHKFKKMVREYNKYKDSHGQNSKPWLQYRAVLSKQELNAVKCKKQPGLVNHMEDFVNFLAKVSRDSACPGHWGKD